MRREWHTQELDAFILAGGESRRMGQSKALMPLGTTSLIGNVILGLRPLFRQIYIIAREGQSYDSLDSRILFDDRNERGPLVGLARGLMETDSPWCLLASCDMPLVLPRVVGHMAKNLTESDAVVLELQGKLQPMPAFYSNRCLPLARELLDAGNTSIQALLARCNVKTMDMNDILRLDPDLRSFLDVDTPEDYKTIQRITTHKNYPVSSNDQESLERAPSGRFIR